VLLTKMWKVEDKKPPAKEAAPARGGLFGIKKK
jgi:hypothetical protein